MVQKLKMLTAKPVMLSSVPRTHLVEGKLSSDSHTHAACLHVQTDRCNFFIKRKDSASAPGRANAGQAMGHLTGSRPG